MKTVWVDTNIVLRFFTEKPREQYERAAALMQRAANGELVVHVTPIVIAEVAAVLHHSFDIPLREIAETLQKLLMARGVAAEDGANVLEALEQSGRLGIDFVDTYLLICARQAGAEVASFDTDFPKRLGVASFSI